MVVTQLDVCLNHKIEREGAASDIGRQLLDSLAHAEERMFTLCNFCIVSMFLRFVDYNISHHAEP